MPISDYSTTRDSNAAIPPGNIRSNDFPRDQQIINSIRQLMADLASMISGGDNGAATFYDFGVWTPTLTCATPGDLSVAYTTRLGDWTKIGHLYFIMFNVTTSTFTHTTASGAVRITGLPVSLAGNGTTGIGVDWSGVTKANYTDLNGIILGSPDRIEFRASGSGVARATVNIADLPTGGTVTLSGHSFYIG